MTKIDLTLQDISYHFNAQTGVRHARAKFVTGKTVDTTTGVQPHTVVEVSTDGDTADEFNRVKNYTLTLEATPAPVDAPVDTGVSITTADLNLTPAPIDPAAEANLLPEAPTVGIEVAPEPVPEPTPEPVSVTTEIDLTQ